MIKKIILITYCGILTSLTGQLYSEPVSLAVINFSNQTGNQDLSNLATALPDSISATLTQLEDIKIVERTQLSQILEELELQLSGLLDENEVSRIGELASADVLLLGSYSGDADKIVLNLKAVKVGTAEVLYGRVIIAPLSNLFEITNQVALVFGAIIAGKDIGLLSISTDPGECDIYIDGMLVGVSPLVEYKLPAGAHRIIVTKIGFREQESTVNIKADEHASWNIVLAELSSKHPWEITIGGMYLQPLNDPLTVDDIKSAFMGFFSFGYAFDQLVISAQYELSWINHDSTVTLLGWTIEQERWYIMNSLKACLTFVPFPELEWASPYVGLLAGGSWIFDDLVEQENKTTFPAMMMAVGGAKVGAHFFTSLRINLFLEGQVYVHSHKLYRTIYESRGLAGGMKSTINKYTSYGFALGGGIRFKL